MEVHVDFTIKLKLSPLPLSRWQKHIKSKKRNKFNMYHERTVRSILHLNQIKPQVGKALVTYAFNYIKRLTYITAYTVKTVQNLCQAPKECKRAVLIMTEKWFFKFVVCICFFLKINNINSTGFLDHKQFIIPTCSLLLQCNPPPHLLMI